MSKKAIETLDRYIRARYPIMGIVSHEESRVMASIKAVAQVRNRKVVTWSLTQGLKQVPLTENDSFSPEYRFDEESTASEFVALEERTSTPAVRPAHLPLTWQCPQGWLYVFALRDHWTFVRLRGLALALAYH